MLFEEFEILKTPQITKIISDNLNASPHELSIKLNKEKMLPHRAIAEQVACNQKAKNKLPSFLNKELLFDKVPLEQASSEFTAKYKTSLISGTSLIDLTGGLGIDDLFFVTSFNKVTYCELNKVTSEIFNYNIKKLDIKNIKVQNSESIEFLTSKKDNSFTWIYVDPARRDANRRSVDFQYCAPNVYDNMELMLEKSQNVMIKAAPAYDLTEAVRRFPNLTEIHVVSVDGECKEVLLLLDRNSKNINPKVVSVKLNSKNNDKFIIEDKFNNVNNHKISNLKSYFYEPDCSIIKSNLTPLLAEKYNLSFVNKLTPYLTNSAVIANFPGRSFIVLDSLVFNEKLIKSYLKEHKIVKANISKRDFRLAVNEIRTKFKLKDGGEYYLFFTNDSNSKPIMIVCKKS